MKNRSSSLDKAPRKRANAALSMLREAMDAREGQVSQLECELLYEDPYTQMTRDAFTFRTPGGVRYCYRRGEQVIVDCPRPQLADECALYLWGTVFGAVAWLNRLIPLHCSAIAHAGGAVAFTAASGGGKSTMAAAMVRRGYGHLCDDTLVLSIADGAPWALPDGKPAKLWADAARMVGVNETRKIDALPGKFYAQPAHASDCPAPLRDIILLEQGEKVTLSPITGSAKIDRLPDLFYRGYLHAALGDQPFHASVAMAIAGKVRFWELSRPIDASRFDAVFDEVVGKLVAAEILPA